MESSPRRARQPDQADRRQRPAELPVLRPAQSPDRQNLPDRRCLPDQPCHLCGSLLGMTRSTRSQIRTPKASAPGWSMDRAAPPGCSTNVAGSPARPRLLPDKARFAPNGPTTRPTQTYIVYPADNQGNAGEQVYSTYLPQMALKGIGNIQLPTNYVYNTAYDAAGRVRLRQLGLNEQNQPIMQTVYQYYDWALQGGRLSSIQAGPL